MIGVVLLPQLLFFWLAPQDAAARWAVYIVGTVLTFLLTCMSFGVCWYVGVRRGAAMAAVSGVFDAAVVGVCAALLASDANVRTALFSLGALVLLYIICAAPLTTGLEELEPGGPPPAPDPAEQTSHPCGGSVPLPPGRDNALNRRGGERHGSDLSAAAAAAAFTITAAACASSVTPAATR